MVLQIIRADDLLIANTTQLVKYPRVWSVIPSNKVYIRLREIPKPNAASSEQKIS